jgi:hypothetical protein
MTSGSPSARACALRTSVAVVALCLAACAGASRAKPSVGYTYSPPRVIDAPNSQTGPYVVVAVDDHFHDIHPSDPPTISADRPFVVKNEGDNLHNFTVPGTAISVDLPPGKTLHWSRIGAHLSPGTYEVVCSYHAYKGMVGLLTVSRAAGG